MVLVWLLCTAWQAIFSTVFGAPAASRWLLSASEGASAGCLVKGYERKISQSLGRWDTCLALSNQSNESAERIRNRSPRRARRTTRRQITFSLISLDQAGPAKSPGRTVLTGTTLHDDAHPSIHRRARRAWGCSSHSPLCFFSRHSHNGNRHMLCRLSRNNGQCRRQAHKLSGQSWEAETIGIDAGAAVSIASAFLSIVCFVE